MIKNFSKIFLRKILTSPAIFSVKFLGLVLGTVTCMLALVYVVSERNYDGFHTDIDNLYRLNVEYSRNGAVEFTSAMSYPAAGPAFTNDIATVEQFCRLRTVWGVMKADIQGQATDGYMVDDIAYADESFFDMFSFDLVKGDLENPLEELHSAVITETVAEKLFGSTDPIGKTIKLKFLNEFEPYKVTAVMKDMPVNSHINYEIILSYKSFINYVGTGAETSWSWFGFYTYLKAKEGANPDEIHRLANDILDTHIRDSAATRVLFQPVADIHLKSDLIDEAAINGSNDQINYLILISLFVFIVGWVNYFNLVSGEIISRNKEIGVRKVLGALDRHVIGQYLFENIAFNLLSFLSSALIFSLLLDSAKAYLGFEVAFSTVEQITFFGSLFIVILLGSLITTLLLSTLLRLINNVGAENYIVGKKNVAIRKGLLTLQFGAAVFFILFTVVIFRQLDFIRSQDKGFNEEQVLVLRAPTVDPSNSNYASKLEAFENTLTSAEGVVSFTASDNIPGEENENMNGGIRRVGSSPDDGSPYRVVKIDDKFFETLQMSLVAGRAFDEEKQTDRSKIILNQAAVKRLGFNSENDAIQGKVIYYNGQTVEVLGVVKNFNQLSFKNAIEPLIFEVNPVNSMFDHKYYSIRYTSELNSLLGTVKKEWNSFFPENPFLYFDLSEFYQKQYAKEQQFARTFFLLSFVTIVSSLLGIIGLLFFINKANRKQIVIRKVLGGNLNSLIQMSTKLVIGYIIVGVIGGFAVSYFIASDWLDNYYQKIELNWQFLAAPIIIPLLIMQLSIIVQVFKLQNVSLSHILRKE